MDLFVALIYVTGVFVFERILEELARLSILLRETLNERELDQLLDKIFEKTP